MAFISIKIPLNFRILLFIILLVSWVSGVTFYLLNNYVIVEGDFGPEKHPWQYNVLMTHGAAAFGMMIFYGSLLTSHIPSGWKSRRLKKLGISMLIALSVQVITAYLLYYMGDEQWRIIIANIHAFNGFVFPLLLITHIVFGMRFRRKRAAK